MDKLTAENLQGRKKFFNTVKEMRKAQKTYFRTKTQQDLMEAKRWETEVDRLIKKGDEYAEQIRSPSFFQ